MKILAFSDLHENMKALEKIKAAVPREQVDLIVCVGDFTVFGRSTKKMLQAINDLGKPVVLIHGNHEDEDEVAGLVEGFPNIMNAHLRIVDTQGLRFMGFGGRGFSQHEPELEEFERKNAESFDSKTIFLCHAPPYGTTLDEVDEDWHVGNESLTELIKRRRPLIVFSGHIHECFHRHDSVAGTILINPGPDGEIIEVEE
jgi:uncharacterized protein